MSLNRLSTTAIGIAYMRANESLRPDRLFDDPYAAAFVAANPPAFSTANRPSAPSTGAGESDEAAQRLAKAGELLSFNTVIRTRFFDDYLMAAIAQDCRQVVLLAAGLDARAYRLPWPRGVRLFELDTPEVLDFKSEVLSTRDATPTCDRVALAVDLREEWPPRLVDSGFDTTAATAWLVEGLLIYLTAAEASELLTRVGELSAPGSEIAFERSMMPASKLMNLVTDLPAARAFTDLFRGGLGEDAGAWLDERGWHSRTHDLVAVAATYERAAPDDAVGGFITAVRA